MTLSLSSCARWDLRPTAGVTGGLSVSIKTPEDVSMVPPSIGTPCLPSPGAAHSWARRLSPQHIIVQTSDGSATIADVGKVAVSQEESQAPRPPGGCFLVGGVKLQSSTQIKKLVPSSRALGPICPLLKDILVAKAAPLESCFPSSPDQQGGAASRG